MIPCPETTIWNDPWQKCAPAESSNSIYFEGTQPATSCHLRWKIPDPIDISKNFELQVSINVKHSANKTYFMLGGFSPGGYSGIQEISPTEKVAIFSLWNENLNNVTLVHQGMGVQVSKFGFEGTGLKSMKPIPWELESDVTFKIEARLVKFYEENRQTWRVRCSYTLDQGKTWPFISEYERTGAPIFTKTGFYSFIEDWGRFPKESGHIFQRKAEFFNAKINGFPIEEATFTKVTYGDDAFAQWKAFTEGKSKTGHGMVLSTGGDIDIENQIFQQDGTKFEL